MPDLHAAHAIYTDAEAQRRWALEAFILSGESFAGIAGRFGVEEGAIAAYEATYFDVLDHLETDYVFLQAIGLHGGPAAPGIGSAWKWWAFQGGPPALDFLLETNPAFVRPGGRPTPVDDSAPASIRDELLRKVAVGVLTLRVDDGSALKLLDLYLRQLRGGAGAMRPAPTWEAFRPNVEAMARDLHRSFGVHIGPPGPAVGGGPVHPGSASTK